MDERPYDRKRAYKQRHPDRVKATAKAYREANPEKFREYRKRHIERYGGRVKRRQDRRSLYDSAFESQGGCCAICRRPGEKSENGHGRGKILVMDHCHATGKFRGLLCHTCNTSLGGFRDCPELLSKAIEYLCRVSVSDT